MSPLASHICSSFHITKIHGGFRGGRRDLVWKMALVCAWQDFGQAYSCTEEAKCAPFIWVCLSAQLWESTAQIASCVLWFLCAHLCVHWLCIILQTCLCLLANPKKPQLCLLSHMCWMLLAHQEHGLKVLPYQWTGAERDCLCPLLQLCNSFLSLALGLQVLWLMGAGSLGSSCGQCSVLIRGRAVLGGFFISWCVNFLLDQQIKQTHPLSPSCCLCCKGSNR